MSSKRERTLYSTIYKKLLANPELCYITRKGFFKTRDHPITNETRLKNIKKNLFKNFQRYCMRRRSALAALKKKYHEDVASGKRRPSELAFPHIDMIKDPKEHTVNRTIRSRFKRRILINSFVFEGKSIEQSAKDAGFTKRVAEEVLKEKKTYTMLKDIMDEMGLSDKDLATKHKELLDAKNSKKHPDYQTQTKALDMAYKIKGSYAPEKQEQVGGITVEVVNFEDVSKEQELDEEDYDKEDNDTV